MNSNSFDTFLMQKLLERELSGNLRKLTLREHLIDFTSNDYLGLAKSIELAGIIESEYQNVTRNLFSRFKEKKAFQGSTGSRLLSGNNELTEKLEAYLGELWNAHALLFNSGYDANLGLFSSIPQKTDTLILDEFIHACIIDGARLSGAKKEKFLHNDLNSLEDKLKSANGNIFVGVESLYSMDGDFSPLEDICRLCEQYQANLIVDEAHTTGMYGPEGKGYVEKLGLHNRVFARIFTFGKALGVHGAVIIGRKSLKDYLINFARTFIYTTSLPRHSIVSIYCAWEFLRSHEEIHKLLLHKIEVFQKTCLSNRRYQRIFQNGPIQVLKIPGNNEARKFSERLIAKRFDIRPILYPSIPMGQERIRICLHNFNEDQDIIDLVNELSNFQDF